MGEEWLDALKRQAEEASEDIQEEVDMLTPSEREVYLLGMTQGLRLLVIYCAMNPDYRVSEVAEGLVREVIVVREEGPAN